MKLVISRRATTAAASLQPNFDLPTSRRPEGRRAREAPPATRRSSRPAPLPTSSGDRTPVLPPLSHRAATGATFRLAGASDRYELPLPRLLDPVHDLPCRDGGCGWRRLGSGERAGHGIGASPGATSHLQASSQLRSATAPTPYSRCRSHI